MASLPLCNGWRFLSIDKITFRYWFLRWVRMPPHPTWLIRSAQSSQSHFPCIIQIQIYCIKVRNSQRVKIVAYILPVLRSSGRVNEKVMILNVFFLLACRPPLSWRLLLYNLRLSLLNSFWLGTRLCCLKVNIMKEKKK